MNVVLDTNVVMSGIFWKGPPRTILLHWYEKKFDLLISTQILDEYSIVANNLNKKYFEIDSQPILNLITKNALLVQPKVRPLPYCRDPDDRMFLEAEISGKAKYIVSGDKDLLEVKKYPGGSVLTPREFLNLS